MAQSSLVDNPARPKANTTQLPLPFSANTPSHPKKNQLDTAQDAVQDSLLGRSQIPGDACLSAPQRVLKCMCCKVQKYIFKMFSGTLSKVFLMTEIYTVFVKFKIQQFNRINRNQVKTFIYQ